MDAPPPDLRLLDGDEDWRRAAALPDALIAAAPGAWDPHDAVGVAAFEGEAMRAAARAEVVRDDADPRRVGGDRWRVTHLANEPSARERGLVEHLMRVQREQALSLGLDLMTWAHDPLDLRPARLAVRRLGAVSRWLRTEGGAQAPRLEFEWWIHSPRVSTLLAGTRPRLELVDALEAGTPKLNASELRGDGRLWPTAEESPPAGAMVLVEIPASLDDPQDGPASLVRAWREQVERLLAQAFAQGYWLTDLLELRGERQPRAYYLLIDGERTLS